MKKVLAAVAAALFAIVAFSGCSGTSGGSDRVTYVSGEATQALSGASAGEGADQAASSDVQVASGEGVAASSSVANTVSERDFSSEELPVSDLPADSASAAATAVQKVDYKKLAAELFKELGIEQDFRKSFIHGDKPAKYQKYIVLHDTEGDGSAEGVINYWDDSGAGVAAHFIVNKDGSIVQCVELDQITHHAGFGDTGHNEKYGVEDESRDDKEGTIEIGEDFADYGMNSYSIGIEMVHVGGSGEYPEAQLEALDGLIAYIDAYYGDNPKQSTIIDHKAWRTGNSDTSEEFEGYLKNYQGHRTHLDQDE